MALLSNDPMTQLAFSVFENKGVFALLLGSGLSRAAEIPTGWEITLDLIRRVALGQGVEKQVDWAQWYRTKFGQEPNYSTLLEELAGSPDERRSILHSYIEPSEEDREEGRKVPTAAHLAIADLVRTGFIRVIITTNFDRLMENALRERGVEPTIVASVDALLGAEPLTHSSCFVLKLHGDYKDARILNTDAELGTYPQEYNLILDRIFDEHGLIIAGWSGAWDHALRAAFLRAPNRRYSVYWAARDDLGGGARDLVIHRDAGVIPITDADSFFSGLKQRVETLAQSKAHNPLSVELLVNSTKRFLGKPEYRIQLDDLFAQETDRLLGALDAPAFSPEASWNPQEFRATIQTYEGATEPLARMAGVVGRWGERSELPLVLDVIRVLYAHDKPINSGNYNQTNIRSYPAVLIFTAYGIGLTRAQRWKTFHQLCSAEIARQHQEPTRLIETLFLWDWEGGEKRLWQQLEGLESCRTPLSEHLYTVFSTWGVSFTGLTPDFEMLYERFEVMGSLAHLSSMPGSDLELTLKGSGNKNPQNCKRIPIGRSGWNTRTYERLFQELNSKQKRKELVNECFVEGEQFIDLFKQNFDRVVQHLGWSWR